MKVYKQVSEVADLVGKFKKLPFLGAFQDRYLKEIFNASKLVAFEAGEVVIPQDAFGNKPFIPLNGRVKVLKGRQLVASIDQPGQVFGEMAMLDQDIRTASVFALDTALCLSVNVSFVRTLSPVDRNACYAVPYDLFAKIVAERLRETTQRLALVSQELEQLNRLIKATGDGKQSQRREIIILLAQHQRRGANQTVGIGQIIEKSHAGNPFGQIRLIDFDIRKSRHGIETRLRCGQHGRDAALSPQCQTGFIAGHTLSGAEKIAADHRCTGLGQCLGECPIRCCSLGPRIQNIQCGQIGVEPFQPLDKPGLTRPRPRPAAIPLDTALVDGHHGDLRRRWRGMAQLKNQIAAANGDLLQQRRMQPVQQQAR